MRVRVLTESARSGGASRLPTRTLTETIGEAGPPTTLTLLVTHATRQDRDAYLRTMDDGLQDAMDALARVCRSLAGGE